MNKIYELINNNDFSQEVKNETSEEQFYTAIKWYKENDINNFNRYYQHNTIVYRSHVETLSNDELVAELLGLTKQLDKQMIEKLSAGNRTNGMRFSELLDNVNLDSNTKVLDFGCGTGVYIDELLKRNVTNIDASEINLTAIEYCEEKYAQSSVNIINANTEQLGTDYDLVIMSNVLHHLGEASQTIINDLYDQMTTNGQFALTELDQSRQTGHHKHHTISHEEIIKLFSKFKLKLSKPIGSDLVLYVFDKQ